MWRTVFKQLFIHFSSAKWVSEWVQERLFAGEMVLGRTHLFKKGLHSEQSMQQGLSRGRSVVSKGVTLKNQGCDWSVNTCLTELCDHSPSPWTNWEKVELHHCLSCYLDFKGGMLSNASLNVFSFFSLILNNKIPFYLLSWLY